MRIATVIAHIMPTQIIRANARQLNTIAYLFADSASALTSTLQALEKHKHALKNGAWVGTSAQAFYKEMETSVLPNLRRLAASFASASTTTDNIGKAMYIADLDAQRLLHIVDAGASRGKPGDPTDAHDRIDQSWAYPAPPANLRNHNQYAPDVLAALGTVACGPVAFAGVVEAMGGSYREAMAWLKDNALQLGYSKASGMQPSDLEAMAQRYFAEMGESATANARHGQSDRATLDAITGALVSGDHVIIDLLALQPSVRTVVSDARGDGRVPDSFAHFARVVGFSPDGSTAYISESLNNGAFVAVPTATLLASMKNPEGRAESNGPVREKTDNWFMVIKK